MLLKKFWDYLKNYLSILSINYIHSIFKSIIIVVFILFTLLSTIFIYQLNKEVPTKNSSLPPTTKPTPIPQKPLKIIGWIPYWDQQNAFRSISQNPDIFDYISLFWYRIDRNGNLNTYKDTVEDQSIIDFAHSKGIRVLALVANLPDFQEGGDWDYRRVNKVIRNQSVRTQHVAELISLVQRNNFDGIDIDYEALKKSQKENFSLFIEELASKLHEQGKILGLAIHPKTGEDNLNEANGSEAQDLVRLSRVVDNMYFMLYTEHTLQSKPGSSGSTNFAKRVISYAKDSLKIPPEKTFFGVGLFGQEWQRENSTYKGLNSDLTYQQIQTILERYSIEPKQHNGSSDLSFEYQLNGSNRIVWFSNTVTVLERIKLAKELHLGGLAFWRLGGEDQRIWNQLELTK